MENLEGEIWAEIPGWGGLYEASTCGRIKSSNQMLRYGGVRKIFKSRILKLNYQKRGYVNATLFYNGIRKTYLVHRLIALTFLPNPENKGFINHKDGNKSNNRVENLEWVTINENRHHERKDKISTSKYLGVYYKKSEGKFCISVRIDNKAISNKRFDSEDDAYIFLVKRMEELNMKSKYIGQKKDPPDISSDGSNG